MDFKQIEGFVRVAELGSFTKAAQLLDTTQPALSRLIRMLEMDLRQTLLVRNTARMHSTLAAYVTAGAVLLDHSGLTRLFDPGTAAGLAGLNQVVTRQAAFIGYIDDFRLMFWMTLLSMPCLLLMRETKRATDKAPDPAEAIAAAAE